jgi:hypothetical protein
MTSENAYRLRDGVVVMADHHGAVVSDDSGDRVYTGNEVASYILSELKTANSLRRIASGLAAKCRMRAEDVLPDVEEFLDQLHRSGLIVAASAELQEGGE